MNRNIIRRKMSRDHAMIFYNDNPGDRKGLAALRICDAVIRNIYANNSGKLAAWLSASHVERG